MPQAAIVLRGNEENQLRCVNITNDPDQLLATSTSNAWFLVNAEASFDIFAVGEWPSGRNAHIDVSISNVDSCWKGSISTSNIAPTVNQPCVLLRRALFEVTDEVSESSPLFYFELALASEDSMDLTLTLSAQATKDSIARFRVLSVVCQYEENGAAHLQKSFESLLQKQNELTCKVSELKDGLQNADTQLILLKDFIEQEVQDREAYANKLCAAYARVLNAKKDWYASELKRIQASTQRSVPLSEEAQHSIPSEISTGTCGEEGPLSAAISVLSSTPTGQPRPTARKRKGKEKAAPLSNPYNPSSKNSGQSRNEDSNSDSDRSLKEILGLNRPKRKRVAKRAQRQSLNESQDSDASLL